MNSSLLQADIDRLNCTLQPLYNPALLNGKTVTWQFRTKHGEQFTLLATPDACEFVVGQSLSPTLTITLDRLITLEDLLQGALDGMQAFMEGRYRADGNIVLSQILLYLFRSGALHRTEVED